MSAKTIKVVEQVGQADAGGVNFPESDLLKQAKKCYDLAEHKTRQMSAVTTGPARVYVVVEQDVITQ